MQSKRRVVVTGVGMLSPLGNNVETSWSGILEGRSGIGPIERFDTSAYTTHFGGGVRNLEVTKYFPAKDARKMDTFIQFGLIAAMQAIADANLVVSEENAHRIGAAIGSGMGGIGYIENCHDTLLNKGPRRLSPFFVPGAIINMVAGQVSIRYGFTGPNIALATACTSGTHSIGLAARLIAGGDADAMVVGGAEMVTTPVGLGGFVAARALSTRNNDPTAASRPWDRDRDGFVLGEGAGMLVIEEYEFAKRRGAKLYAEIVGFGMSADAHHITSPPADGKGASLAIASALRDAAMNPQDIDYINAHGTSTMLGDVAEVRAIKRALGDASRSVAVSSTKSMTGHLLGAAGAVEAIFSVLALRDQVAPPTINLDHPGEDCDLNFVPHTAQQRAIDVCLSNSFGFGGTNGALIFRRV